MGAEVDHVPVQPGVPLSEAIEMLRSELQKASELGEGHSVRFDVPEVTVALSVVATKGADGKAGLHWWVIDAGGSAKWSTQQTQTLTLTLRPKQVTDSGTTDLRVNAPDVEFDEADVPA